MDWENINNIRQKLKEFFLSQEKITDFMVNCDLKDRIRFIYSVIFPKGRKVLFYFRFFFSKVAYYIDYSPIKVLIYKLIGVKIGKGVFISPDVIIDVHFPQLITIDDYAIIGYGVKIFTHDFYQSKYRIGRIHIGKGAVIGAYSLIAAGVSIGEMVNIRAKSSIGKDVINKNNNDIFNSQ